MRAGESNEETGRDTDAEAEAEAEDGEEEEDEEEEEEAMTAAVGADVKRAASGDAGGVSADSTRTRS